MTDRKELEAGLLGLIRRTRAKISPEVLEKAEKSLKPKSPAKQTEAPAISTPAESLPAGTLPYDRKAASETIRLFLERHSDATVFQEKLIRRLKDEELKG